MTLLCQMVKKAPDVWYLIRNSDLRQTEVPTYIYPCIMICSQILLVIIYSHACFIFFPRGILETHLLLSVRYYNRHYFCLSQEGEEGAVSDSVRWNVTPCSRTDLYSFCRTDYSMAVTRLESKFVPSAAHYSRQESSYRRLQTKLRAWACSGKIIGICITPPTPIFTCFQMKCPFSLQFGMIPP